MRPTPRAFLFLPALVLAATAGTRASRPAALAPPPAFPRYDEVYGIATHNSYWTGLHPRELPWPFARVTGTRERLTDQLLHEGARAIELDVHRDAAPGAWAIYHTDDRANSQCATLAECLKRVQTLHWALPEHEVVNIIIELKETWPPYPSATAHAFDATHTIEQFDDTFRRYLGDTLFTPADFLRRGPRGATMLACGAAAGWPRTDELRGKFIVNVLGNWSNASFDWAYYATAQGGAARRVAFPMRSIMARDGSEQTSGPGSAHDPIDPAVLAAAREASIFWQVEALDFGEVPDFVGRKHGVVRGCDSFGREEQRDRLRRGFQLVQTDYPWFFERDYARAPGGLATDPSRRLFDPAPLTGARPLAGGALVEPGSRAYFAAREGAIFRYVEIEAAGGARMEVVLSGSTTSERAELAVGEPPREGGGGGIRAESEDGVEWLEIRRGLDVSGHSVVPIVVEGRSLRAGAISQVVLTDPCAAGRAGDMLELAVANDGAASRVRAASAGELEGADIHGAPDYAPLGSWAFARPLRRIGLLARGADVLFLRPQLRGATIALADLPAERAEGVGSLALDLSYPAR